MIGKKFVFATFCMPLIAVAFVETDVCLKGLTTDFSFRLLSHFVLMGILAPSLYRESTDSLIYILQGYVRYRAICTYPELQYSGGLYVGG